MAVVGGDQITDVELQLATSIDIDGGAKQTKLTNDMDIDESLLKKCDPCCVKTWTICQIFGFLMGLSWILFLLIMLCQPTMADVHDIIINNFDSTATGPFGSFTTDCTVSLTNITSHFSIFLFFHFLRHYLTAFVLRNRGLLWINSILWEIVEYLFFNFSIFKINAPECWWDSVFFDLFGMNWLGLELGLLTMKLINGECNLFSIIYFYDDLNLKSICCPKMPTCCRGCFGNKSTDEEYDEEEEDAPLCKCGPVSWLVFLCLLVAVLEQLNAFAVLILAFWMPVTHVMEYYRILAFLLMLIFALSQVNEIVTFKLYSNWIWNNFNDIKDNLLQMSWLIMCLIVTVLECSLVARAYAEW